MERAIFNAIMQIVPFGAIVLTKHFMGRIPGWAWAIAASALTYNVFNAIKTNETVSKLPEIEKRLQMVEARLMGRELGRLASSDVLHLGGYYL